MAACHDIDVEKEIEKEPAKSLPLSESQDDILGRGFEAEAVSSCTRLLLHRLCLGLVSRTFGPVLITHAGLQGGWVLALREKCEVKYRHCLL